MGYGRPRTQTPSDEECAILGQDLVKWAYEEKGILISEWYCLKHGINRKQWKAMKDHPSFLPYYEQAMVPMAKKAIDGTIEKSFGHRYLRLYDRDIRDDEDDKVKFDAEVRRLSENQVQDLLVKIINYADVNK